MTLIAHPNTHTYMVGGEGTEKEKEGGHNGETEREERDIFYQHLPSASLNTVPQCIHCKVSLGLGSLHALPIHGQIRRCINNGVNMKC